MASVARKRKADEDIPESSKHCRSNNVIEEVTKQEGIRGYLVFLQNPPDEPYGILQSAACHEKLGISIHKLDNPTDNNWPEWGLRIGDELVARGKFFTETMARTELSRTALEDLKKCCFTIIKKVKFIKQDTVSKGEMSTKPADEKPASSSLGAKMLAKMGWSGGGLGVNEQGRLEAVEAYEQVNRQGLGTTNITQKITGILKDFVGKRTLKSLAFSTEFTNQERAQIHSLARKNNLISKSHGKGDERMLVVSQKFSRWELVETIVDAGGETEQYQLIYPSNFL